MNFDTLIQVFTQAVTHKRPHGSMSEARFVTWLSKTLPCTLIDGAGNLHFDLRFAAEGTSRTLFTAHTDTVHHADDGPNKYRVDGRFWRADGDVLGADDGAGVALIAHMIEARVPGYYILFRGEECGGIGSSWLAENMPDLLAEFDRAVAFDRAGYYDVITHQSRSRCCSDEFADALANQMADAGLMYAPCDGGVYTDTAEFVHLIPECTNLSVGYKAQHSDREEQDMEFLELLAEAVTKVQWDTLPTKRDTAEAPARRDSWTDYLGARYGFDRDCPMSDADMDGAEALMVDAINDALDNKDFTLLHKLVADALGAESAQQLRLSYQRLDRVTLNDALDWLYAGFSVEEVSVNLYEVAAIH